MATNVLTLTCGNNGIPTNGSLILKLTGVQYAIDVNEGLNIAAASAGIPGPITLTQGSLFINFQQSGYTGTITVGYTGTGGSIMPTGNFTPNSVEASWATGGPVDLIAGSSCPLS